MRKAELYLPIFETVPEIKAFFSTKEGASQSSPYENQQVLAELGLQNMHRAQPKQVHKDHIAIVEKADSQRIVLENTDGMITNLRNILLTTVHADCLPIYFYDPIRKAIGLVHAGWRGTNAGIAQKAALLMEKTYGCKPSDIKAVIGPGIGQCCFEVGEEVFRQFEKRWNFIEEFTEETGEKYKIDLKGINQRQLESVGVKDIQSGTHCTCCQPELFCSYRREGETYQRMGAGIYLL